MLRSIFFIVAISLGLAPATTKAQEWRFQSFEPTGGGATVNSAGIEVSSKLFVAGMDHETGKWLVSIAAPTVEKAEDVTLDVLRKGKWFSEHFRGKQISFFPDAYNGQNAVSFYVTSELLELLMSGEIVVAEIGSRSLSFPLSGSRDSISRMMAANRDHREAVLDDLNHTILQSISDCDQMAAHPDDERNPAPGVPWDDLQAELAIETCEFASENSEGQVQVRMLYQLGRALDRAGDERAFRVLFKAGENYGYPIALNHLGIFFRDGEYTDTDISMAARMFGWAMNKGNYPAQHNLGMLKIEKLATPEAKKEGFDLLHLAAMEGYALSQQVYGRMILNGEAPETDVSLAFYLLNEASDAGRANASFDLARMYADGIGVLPSAAKYVEYLRRAAEQGHRQAREELGWD